MKSETIEKLKTRILELKTECMREQVTILEAAKHASQGLDSIIERLNALERFLIDD